MPVALIKHGAPAPSSTAARLPVTTFERAGAAVVAHDHSAASAAQTAPNGADDDAVRDP